MNIWIGTDLAADILGSVKDTPTNLTIKGFVQMLKDAESRSLPQKNLFTTVLIQPYR